MRKTLTSDNFPLDISEMSIPNIAGKIGLSMCPGKKSDDGEWGLWDRNLKTDLQKIQNWGAKRIITLIEQHEFALLKVESLGKTIKAMNIKWHHLPIKDNHCPDSRFKKEWLKIKDEILQSLNKGEKILIHCRGGQGRAGTIAAEILINFNLNPQDAINHVRTIRPGAIVTKNQELYLLQKTPID